MVTVPVPAGSIVPTWAISGQSPLPTSGADSSRCGTVSLLMNLTVTGWLRGLSTGPTPAAVLMTVGAVRGGEGASGEGVEGGLGTAAAPSAARPGSPAPT